MKLLNYISISSIALLTSCMTTVPQQQIYTPPIKPRLSTNVNFKLMETKQKDQYTKEIYQTPTSTLTLYNAKGQNPSILVMPQLKGSDIIAHWYAKRYAKEGMNAAVLKEVELKEGIKQEQFEKWAKATYENHRQAVKWLREYEIPKTAVVGVSFGGILAASLAGDEQTDASVLIMSGASLEEIVETSDLGIIKRLKKNIPKESLQYLQEPLNHTSYINPDSTLLFITKHDKTVPYNTQENLRQALNFPKTFYIPTNHYFCALYVKAIEDKSAEFLQEKLLK